MSQLGLEGEELVWRGCDRGWVEAGSLHAPIVEVGE